MRFVMFAHSLRSDWNHGNAHFLRGVARELQARGHEVVAWEQRQPWSVTKLLADVGDEPLHAFQDVYPTLDVRLYDPGVIDLDGMLRGADVVLVHEWTAPTLVRRIGEHRAAGGDYALLFHDSHHRSVSKPKEMRRYDLSGYDGVLAFGDAVREVYLEKGWAREAWTWQEAADTRVFHPMPEMERTGDLVWVGNWGDDERTQELDEFLLTPARKLRLKTRVHGVRYPPEARRALKRAGIEHEGWVPNFKVPEVFARHRVTVHVPRRPYVEKLPGIPTIRVFEALACGIPLVSAPWEVGESGFTPGEDFLMARDGREMRRHLRSVLADEGLARSLAERGLRTVRASHTCGHRADELVAIARRLRGGSAGGATLAATGAAAPGRGLRIAFFASSLVSSYWNGAATYYRGILRALAKRGCDVTFFEPDARDRQRHRDIDDPDWCKVVVYPVGSEADVRRALEQARGADVVVKASGVGVYDELLEEAVLELQSPTTKVVYWDVDAPATLDRVHQNPHDAFRKLVPRYDAVFTYGGGPPVVKAYEALGARTCVPVYNALDPETHHPAQPDQRFEADLALLANRLPDRERRIEEFFLSAAKRLPGKRFLLGGAGWEDKPMPDNVRRLGHVGTRDHNAFNCTPMAVLNVNRESMARYGWSPPTRVFEAAGAGACVVTDEWEGIQLFLEPGKEVLVARDGEDVARIVASLTPERAREIGRAARERMLRGHTYDHRAEQALAALSRLRKAAAPEARA